MEGIRSLIDTYIKKNGNQDITGDVLNNVLQTLVDDLESYVIESLKNVKPGTPGEGTIVLDDFMSDISENGVMNRVIKAYVDDVRNDMPNFWRLEDGKVVTDKSVIIHDNLVVEGDVASSAPGENNPVGIQGIKLNGQTYTDYDGDGVIDLGEIGGGDLDIGTLETYLSDNKYINADNLDTYGVATKSWVEGKSYLTSSALNGYATQSWVNEQGFAKASAIPTLKSLMGGSAIGGTTSYIYWNGSAWATKTLGDRAFDSTAYQPLDTAINTGNIGNHAVLLDGGGTITRGNLIMSATASDVVTNTLYPRADASFILGQASRRWSTIYGVNGNFSGNIVVSGDIASGGEGQDTTAYLPLSGGTLTSSGSPLFINRTSGNPVITFQANGTTVGVLGFYASGGGIMVRPNATTNTNYYSVIHTGNIESYAPIYNASGNVGIGTTSPVYKLDVNGNMGVLGPLLITGTEASQAILSFPRASANYIIAPSGGTINFNVTGSAAVSSAQLRVSSSAVYKGSSATVDLGTSSSRWTTIYGGKGDFTGAVTQGSDIRFKHRLADYQLSLEDMAYAPLFSFYWNDRNDNQIHIGTSAQYWEMVASPLVSGTDFKGLDYSTLGVAMGISNAREIRELKAEIKRLKEVA